MIKLIIWSLWSKISQHYKFENEAIRAQPILVKLETAGKLDDEPIFDGFDSSLVLSFFGSSFFSIQLDMQNKTEDSRKMYKARVTRS